MYSAATRIISPYALSLVQTIAQQLTAQGKRPPNECTGRYRSIMGLPCKHDLAVVLASNGWVKLMPTDLHDHWWNKPSTSHMLPSRLLEPRVIVKKRCIEPSGRTDASRHQRGHGVSSTRREPTWSERVDLNSATQSESQNDHQTLLYLVDNQQPDDFHSPSQPPRGFGYANQTPWI
ncbi:hypothetical protein AC1031_006364 [Aphanomyces cochlioides]|nr:hypothetical protein AC1031_006364 [Aphanomyces cochlioides]